MALLAVQDLDADGVIATFAAATVTEGDTAPIGEGNFFIVRNGSGGNVTATYRIPVAVGGVRVHAIVIAAAGVHVMPLAELGALPQGAVVRDNTTTLAKVTMSAVTSVTLGAFKAH
jgi:hypothetical protein